MKRDALSLCAEIGLVGSSLIVYVASGGDGRLKQFEERLKVDTITVSEQLFLYRLGSAQIPAEHLRRKKAPISLVVASGIFNSSHAVGVAKHLATHRDGDVYVLSTQLLDADLERMDVQILMSPSIEATVYVLFNEDGNLPLPPRTISYLFQINLRKVCSIDRRYEISAYRRPEAGKRQVLFVSAGSIYPLSLGSHQRMFNSIQGLIDAGCDITVLYQQQRREREIGAVAALSLVATETRAFKPQWGKLRGKTARRRTVYNTLAKWLKVSNPNKQTFAEKCQKRSSFWLYKELKQLGETGAFDAVWVNYAWMMGKVDNGIRRLFHTVICDTHDVQFFRNDVARPLLDRIILNQKYDKVIEINQLKKADIVLAISDRDATLLKDTLPEKRVITLVPSFDQHQKPVRPRDIYKPLVFGFIGTRMDANVKALEYVIRHWWPELHKYSPESRLLVAGSVCEEPSVQAASWLYDEIELLGFVDDLSEYYSKIDALLSPVLVRGGLNFKNVEAAMAGKHVITNSDGAEALAPVPVKALTSAQDVIGFLTEIEMNPQLDLYLRMEVQRAAANRFSNSAEFESIISEIASKRENNRA
ncbi:glycosyltransferase involved in cell wall biosynthesis [Sinorhizobium fredii]|uniref:Cps10D: Cps10D n=1 Tax=Sinorhizobium fredii (strain USDA 257) TaxID=1185652 RepID=I3X6D8_SINF2|nr:glycosyltransferase [Sinorhizobium fredii]AFL51444.1 cps10D: Cps10D [Sinorhizobium fredii USDA 257]